MATVQILAEGQGQYLKPDPDGYREWVRNHKGRALVPKLLGEKEAIDKFVADGDYIVYECNYLQRGPAALVREIIRQKKKNLWVGGKFTYVDVALLAAAGCLAKADVGFFIAGPTISRLIQEGKLTLYEYSNVVMANRIMAGAMGLPFLPVRSLGGTDNFPHSGAKLIADPYTGQPITIVPALNPDVALIHVHQCDQYGNARIFGTGIAHTEAALASRKVIISTEEVIDVEEVRRDPGRTTIPYYVVDAVVHLPFGAYPGEMQGMYASDPQHVMEVFAAIFQAREEAYLEKWVHSVANHTEMLEKRVGFQKLEEMKGRATIKEGYSA